MWNLLDFQYIRTTLDYSNAVLVTVLPYVSDFAAKLNLPLPQPIPLTAVKSFGCNARLGDTGGGLLLTNGYAFFFENGYLHSFYTPKSYEHNQNFNLIPQFYGTNRISTNEGVRLCRNVIRRLGYTEEQLYADLQPEVKTAGGKGNKTIPRYFVSWTDPRDGSESCKFEVNSDQERVESIIFFSSTLWQKPPHVNVSPMPRSKTGFKSRYQPVNPLYASGMIPAVLPLIEDFAKRLNLPVTRPITTNHILSSVCRKFDNEPYVDLRLTNGYHFFVSRGIIQNFDAPDCFFDTGFSGVKIKDYIGNWRMDDGEALKLAQDTLQKLGYSLTSLDAEREPDELRRPFKIKDVPRFRINWLKISDGVVLSNVALEIDGDNKTVKSVSISIPGLDHSMPDIGVSPDSSEFWMEAPSDAMPPAAQVFATQRNP
jgi:hypothetical protein